MGSVNEVLRLRLGSTKSCVFGGGRNESSRTGGFVSRSAGGQPLRFGELVVCEFGSSNSVFFSSEWRSAEAKLRAAELRGRVDSSAEDGRMMVFLQRSQIPEAYVIDCLQLLQVATAVDVAIGALRNLKS